MDIFVSFDCDDEFMVIILFKWEDVVFGKVKLCILLIKLKKSGV